MQRRDSEAMKPRNSGSRQNTTDGFHPLVKSIREALEKKPLMGFRQGAKSWVCSFGSSPPHPFRDRVHQSAISRPQFGAKAISRSHCFKISPFGEIHQWFQ